MLKLVILDWNGTAFDDAAVTIASVQEIFKRYGLPAPPDEAYFNEISADFMRFYWEYGIPRSASAADLNSIRKQYFEEHWGEGRLREGVKELLEWCRSRGIHTAIVSGEIAEVLAARCESLSLHSLINHIQGGVSKKEVALKKTLRHFNLLPQHAVYVDDTYDGLSSALRVGTLTVGFTNGYGSFEKIRAANPHFPNERFPRINDFHVVRQVIELHTENRTRAS